MPTLRQWEYVVRVVDEGSFTAAAHELHVSQPGLSQQVHVLETELGGALFDRLPRAVVLTPLGRAVIPHARALLADARRAFDAARSVVEASSGGLEVVTITSIGIGVLPGVLEVWLKKHPGTSVRVFEHATVDDMVESMLTGEGDVAVAPMPRTWPGPQHLIGREEFVVVANADHPLAGRGPVRMADLAREDWVQFTPEHGLSGLLERDAAEAGFTPRVALRTPQTAAAPRFASAGVGVALVPANVLDAGFTGTILRLNPPRTRAIRAATRSKPGPLVREFINTVVQHADLAGPLLL